MKKTQKGDVVAVLLCIIALLVVGGGLYIYSQHTPASAPVSIQTPSQTPVNTSPTQTPSNPDGIAVAGMQEYTDTNLGFSFWYPDSWAVETVTNAASQAISGGTITKTLKVGPSATIDAEGVTIEEFVSSAMSIMDSSNPGPAGDGAGVIIYRFDPTIHSWTEQYNDTSTNSMTTRALTTFTNSMGGLHILGGNARFGADVILPLSAQDFLVVSATDPGGTEEQTLAQTITATDPAVATPVAVSQQVSTIQAEGILYGTLGTRVGNWYVYGQYVYDLRGDVLPGAIVSTFRVITTYSDGYTTTSTAYATDGNQVYSDWSYTSPVLVGADPATFVAIRQSYQIPYAQSSGAYGQSFTSYDTDFAKDKSHVWYSGHLIPGADPSTFVVTGDTHVANSAGGYTIAHDAYHVYGLDSKDENFTIDGAVVQLQ